MMTTTPADYKQALAFFLVVGIKATVPIAVAWLISSAARRCSSAMRHHVWSAAILASLALPFFAVVLPAWRSAALSSATAFWSPVRVLDVSAGAHTIPPVAISVTSGFPLLNQFAVFALLVWALGFSVALLRLLAGLARLAWASSHLNPLSGESWFGMV